MNGPKKDALPLIVVLLNEIKNEAKHLRFASSNFDHAVADVELYARNECVKRGMPDLDNCYDFLFHNEETK
jgi:hypothetical protein